MLYSACNSKGLSDLCARSARALALGGRLQEHVPLPPFLRAYFVRRVQRHHRTAVAAVRRPMRQFRTVGVAVSDEIHPVARRQLRQLAIGVFVQPWERVEIVEHIEEFARMEGAGVATVAFAEPPLRRQRRAVETEAENVGPAVLLLRLDPGPGRMGG